jgi:DNA-directed RNA polymerase subunit H (RpoH/RPB5)
MKKAYTTCLEMLQQRGYQIEDIEENRITATKSDGNLMCAFFLSTQVNVKRIEELVGLMHELAIKHSVIINTGGVTPPARKTVDSSLDLQFELFDESELQTNISKHVWQPVKFEILSSDETQAFKQKYNISKIAVMHRTDAIARFYNYQKGSIIRIHRNTGYITYRAVK